MSKDKKIIHLRDKSGQHYAGSVSLGGKTSAPKNKGKSANRELQDILFKSGAEYRLATQEFDAKYEMELGKAKKIFSETLSPEAKMAYFKYDGWNAFDLAEFIEDQDHEKYDEAKKILKEKIDAALKERSAAVNPFWQKRQAEFAEAKSKHPKKWWQSQSSWLGDICESCGAKVSDYCPKCNPGA